MELFHPSCQATKTYAGINMTIRAMVNQKSVTKLSYYVFRSSNVFQTYSTLTLKSFISDYDEI